MFEPDELYDECGAAGFVCPSICSHLPSQPYKSLPLIFGLRGVLDIVEQASTMGTELHLREDHPVALELKSLRKSVATFQVRLHVQFYQTAFY
jgi:hypothetical protein